MAEVWEFYSWQLKETFHHSIQSDSRVCPTSWPVGN